MKLLNLSGIYFRKCSIPLNTTVVTFTVVSNRHSHVFLSA